MVQQSPFIKPEQGTRLKSLDTTLTKPSEHVREAERTYYYPSDEEAEAQGSNTTSYTRPQS